MLPWTIELQNLCKHHSGMCTMCFWSNKKKRNADTSHEKGHCVDLGTLPSQPHHILYVGLRFVVTGICVLRNIRISECQAGSNCQNPEMLHTGGFSSTSSAGEEVCGRLQSDQWVHGQRAGWASEAAVSRLQDWPDRRPGGGGDTGQTNLHGTFRTAVLHFGIHISEEHALLHWLDSCAERRSPSEHSRWFHLSSLQDPEKSNSAVFQK